MESAEPQQKNPRWLAFPLSIFFIALAILFSASLAFAQKYKNQIYPGVTIAGVEVSGLTKSQAQDILTGKFKQTFDSGFVFFHYEIKKQITNDDLTIFNINFESVVNKAFSVGRTGNAGRDYLTRIIIQAAQKDIALDYRLDKNLLKTKLNNEFSGYQNPAKNSEIILTIKNEKKRKYDLAFTNAATGEVFDFDSAIEFLDREIADFNNPAVILTSNVDEPKITLDEALNQTDKIKSLLALEPPTLIFEDKTWPIKWSDFAHMLELSLDDAERTTVQLNPVLVKGQLESISQTINQKATDAKFKMENSRVVEFIPSQKGLELDQEESYKKINDAIINGNNSQIELIVKITEPEIGTASVNDLGINEIVGVGHSNFSGSPANRRHNIGIGAAALNGVLIKPNEEFSLVKALGKIDGEHGYKPELVIKKNKTLPEFGGGLCQIGTTIFRSALASGLKITARTNHSYRVIYYEPAGTDATIYDPWPDVRFINDTDNHILIQSKIWGNNLAFEFWGTRDGRKTQFEGENKTDDLKKLKPKIFNVTSPGPAKEVETEELKPGEKKKIESAHNGADTAFTQYITYSDGREEKSVYKSHYVPWQEVWLVGTDPAKKLTELPATDALTSTSQPTTAQ